MLELNLVTKASFSLLSLTFSLYIFLSISLSCFKYLPFYWTNHTAKLIRNKIFACNLFKCVLINIDRVCCFCVWMLLSIVFRVDSYVDWYLRASIDICTIISHCWKCIWLSLEIICWLVLWPVQRFNHITIWHISSCDIVKGIIHFIASVQNEL